MLNKEILIEQMKESVSLNAAEILNACDDLLICQAAEQTVKEIAEEIETKVLAENEYMMDAKYIDELNEAAAEGKLSRRCKVERITRPFDSYLMADADFQDYLEKCYDGYVKAGIAHPWGKGFCPDAPYREARIKAENALLDLFERIMPEVISHEDYNMMRKHWKYRERLINLALDMKKLEGIKEAE